jgi:hypothetical protein
MLEYTLAILLAIAVPAAISGYFILQAYRLSTTL